MNAGARTNGGLSAVPLLNAVFCAGCETISNSPHDACTVCGSSSLSNLFRMLEGTLRTQKPQSAEDHGKTVKYNVELTVKVHEIPADELNRAIESISRLADVCGDMEFLHINVESVFGTEAVLRAA
jgi:RNA polymerase subunit RPABC4/transcription elongation factor Spt4